MASPTDITLLGDGGEGHTVLVISVTRYSIPETPTKPSEDNQVGLSTFEQGKYSDKDGDEEGEIDACSAAMFNDQLPRPASSRVDGGALLWLTLGDNPEIDNSDADLVPNTMCVLKFPVDRVELAPSGVSCAPSNMVEFEDDFSDGNPRIVEHIGYCSASRFCDARDAIMQLESMNRHGCGLAALMIPSSCSMGLRETRSLFSPMFSKGVRCFDIVSPGYVSRWPLVTKFCSTLVSQIAMQGVRLLRRPRDS